MNQNLMILKGLNNAIRAITFQNKFCHITHLVTSKKLEGCDRTIVLAVVRLSAPATTAPATMLY